MLRIQKNEMSKNFGNPTISGLNRCAQELIWMTFNYFHIIKYITMFNIKNAKKEVKR